MTCSGREHDSFHDKNLWFGAGVGTVVHMGCIIAATHSYMFSLFKHKYGGYW